MKINKECTSIRNDFKEILLSELNNKKITINKSIINNIQDIIKELDVKV